MDLLKLSAAKLWVISKPSSSASDDKPCDQPYLAVALFALHPVPSTHVGRMAVDECWRLYINPEWLTGAGIPTIGRELAHLIWHLLSEHASRARSVGVSQLSAPVWKLAADASIADMIGLTGLKPKRLARPYSLGLPYNRAAEEYYELLAHQADIPVREDSEDCGSGADGLPRDYELPPDSDIGVIGRHDIEAIRHQVAIAYREQNGGRGSRWSGLGRWASGILEPTVPWEPLLAGAIRQAVARTIGRGDFTYRRPSRRASLMPNVVLPSQHRAVPRIAIVVDTSSSVDDTLLGRALGEVDNLLMSLNITDSGVAVYSVDSAAAAAQRIRRAKDLELVGAGGTDMRVGIEAAIQAQPRPEVVVVITDGYTPWPAEAPHSTSVVIALLGRRGSSLPSTPAWAIRVECLLETHAS
ncbi:hypothetical protein H7K14_11475 [Mycolicibacter longobardus]|uniref:vWA domain-containing protein n=1 Tax=Mycolicibacter longobardus TaxID=1108812 RepID=UPI0021F38674|nr:VWA-like domain-containing protein [Mycolicibacter longobardus]MCV7384458.1 hypothetical protein [Mycolicibacter longobardus]